MSNLRERLKKISAEKKAEAAPTVQQRPKCAFRTRIVDAPSMRFEGSILALLGGEDFADRTLRSVTLSSGSPSLIRCPCCT